MVIALMGGEEGLKGIWPYIVLLPFFVVQLVWPTTAGWFGTLIGWLCFGLGVFAYERFALGVTEFSNWVLLYWGVAPLIVLLFFKPKSPTDSPEERAD